MTKPKTSKKNKTDFEKIYAEFQSELNDKELQNRYDGFKKTREAAKERHNTLVPIINALIADGNSLKDLIVDLAIHKLCTEEATKKIVKVKQEIDELRENIMQEQKIMAEEDALIKKYEDYSERKFFHYWKIFRVLDPNTPSWIDWYKQYKGQII